LAGFYHKSLVKRNTQAMLVFRCFQTVSKPVGFLR